MIDLGKTTGILRRIAKISGDRYDHTHPEENYQAKY
jgi:hypothetical protein